MAGIQSGISVEQFVWVVGALCRAYSLPFDASLLRQRFPPPHATASILDAAEMLGLQSQQISGVFSRVRRITAPCLLFLRPESGQPSPAGVGLMLRMEEGRADLIEPAAGEPRTLTLDALEARFAGEAITFTRKPAVASGDTEPQPAFGFSWIARELWRHPSSWTAVLGASFALQILSLATPLLTQVVIDKVIVHQSLQTLWVVCAALFIATIFSGVLSAARQYLLLHIGNRVDARLATRLFDHLLCLPVPYFERRSTGTLVARLQGVETVREFLAGAALLLVIELPFALVFVAAMIWYSPMLAMIAMASLVLLVVLALLVAPELRRRLDRLFLLGARNQAFLTEHIAGIETVKSLQMEGPLARRYETGVSEYLSAGVRARVLASGYGITAHSIEQVMSLLVLCSGAWLVMQNAGFSIGMLVAFQMFAGRAAQPFIRIAGLWQEFQQAAIAVRRIGDIADTPAEPYSVTPSRSGRGTAVVEFDDVSFRYRESGRSIIERLSFRVMPGECVAIVGPSGSGKSTVARLLQGFAVPDSGRVRLGNCDLRNLPVNEIRSMLGVVPQDTILFSGSVFDNLVMADSSVSFDEVVNACRFAEIHDFIESLPEGYRTILGEHGAGLSGGQKQRLAVARALLKRPGILLFDEATSHLDARTADSLCGTIARLRGRATVLFIAHHVPDSLRPDRMLELGGTGAPR